MAYLKTIQIIGNVGREPEMKFAQSGTAITSFSVAVNDRPRKGQEQEGEQTTWFRVTAFGRQAETVNEIVKKGISVYVSGEFSAREWTGTDGKPRTSLEIAMQEMKLLTPKGQQEGDTPL